MSTLAQRMRGFSVSMVAFIVGKPPSGSRTPILDQWDGVGNPDSITTSLFRRKKRLEGCQCAVAGPISCLEAAPDSLEITAEVGPRLVLDLVCDRFCAAFRLAGVVEAAHPAHVQLRPAGAALVGARQRQGQVRDRGAASPTNELRTVQLLALTRSHQRIDEPCLLHAFSHCDKVPFNVPPFAERARIDRHSYLRCTGGGRRALRLVEFEH